MVPSLQLFLRYRAEYPEESKHLRLGQHFVNRYIKQPMPILFYEEDEVSARVAIETWLVTHNYVDELPQLIERK